MVDEIDLYKKHGLVLVGCGLFRNSDYPGLRGHIC